MDIHGGKASIVASLHGQVSEIPIRLSDEASLMLLLSQAPGHSKELWKPTIS